MKIKHLLIVLIGISGCHEKTPKTGPELSLFAGVGMKDAVSEIIDSFCIAHPQIKVINNWAPSGLLAKQIAQEQVPDVFISANQK